MFRNEKMQEYECLNVQISKGLYTMARKKADILAGLSGSAAKKQAEHEEVLEEKQRINRSFDETDPKAPMTIVLHETTRQRIKMLALKKRTTVSALIEEWLEEHSDD